MSKVSQRLSSCFDNLRAVGRKALVPYISAGDPDPAQTVAIMHALVDGGADILELGVPFSDPAADGETIQQANERALARQVDFAAVCQMVTAFRQQDGQTPIVVMGYLNSFERRGFDCAVKSLSAAGVDAVILVDCPIEALPDYQSALDDAGIIPILLVAPTTGEARLDNIVQAAKGFIYYVSLRGVTGKQAANAESIADGVGRLRETTDTPVLVGFGIRDGKTARAMAAIADGVVIGSALVASLHQAAGRQDSLPDTARRFVANIRQEMDRDERGQKQ